MNVRSHPRGFIAAAAFALAMLAAPLAQAFTFEEQGGTNADGSAKFADPAARLSGNGSGNSGLSTYRSGNTTFQFGSQRSLTDQRYNTDRMFNPNGRPGDDR